MSLDITKIALQASNMVVRLKEGRAERQQRLQYARQIFGDEAIDLERLKRKVAASRTTWLVAELCDGLAERYPAPCLPAAFSVLAASDVFVLASVSEGLPNAVLEAMACGRPVVASRVGGVPEILEHRRSGLLVPAGDAVALAGAILELGNDASLSAALGAAARERAIALPAHESYARTLELNRERLDSWNICLLGFLTH